MKVMLLAAGQGKRMRPLTDNKPKPLLEIAGKTLIEWQIERLMKANFREFVINCGYLGAQIPEYLGDGSKYGIEITYSMEPEQGLETGGGIVNALPLLGEQPFAVVNSDVWTDFPYNLLRLPANRLAHVILVENPEHHPKGDFVLHSDGSINELGEDKKTYSGIGVFHPDLFSSLAPRFFPLAPILRSAMAGKNVSGEIYYGDWVDIGTPERLQALEEKLQAL